MRMKAAVVYEQKKPLVVEDIEIDEPGQGEVMVKMVGTGLCHTDLGFWEGGLTFPIVLGHEGAGIVHKVGPGVNQVKPGDHVVITGAASCGRCRMCRAGSPVMCDVYRPYYWNGYLPGNQIRLHTRAGKPVHHFFLQSSFAEYAIAPQDAAIKVREDAPLNTIGILGCGVLTGMGAVINKLKPEVGSTIAVFGCGGVGMSSIIAARLVGCGRIIAIDTLDSKLELAREFGATHFINPKKEDPVARIRQMTGGGADYSVMAVGSAEVITQAFDALRFGGTCVVMGAPPTGAKLTVDVLSLIREKKLVGSSMGSSCTARDIPAWADLFMEGRIPLEKLVMKRFPLSDINEAFHALEKGEVIKAVITF